MGNVETELDDNAKQTTEFSLAEQTALLSERQMRITELGERLGYQHDFAQAALKNLMLVNGGSIVALLTFIGNKGLEFDDVLMWWAFFSFGVGLLLSFIALITAYLSQGAFMQANYYQAERLSWRLAGRVWPDEYVTKENEAESQGDWCRWIAIAACIAGVLSFCAGSLLGLNSLL